MCVIGVGPLVVPHNQSGSKLGVGPTADDKRRDPGLEAELTGARRDSRGAMWRPGIPGGKVSWGHHRVEGLGVELTGPLKELPEKGETPTDGEVRSGSRGDLPHSPKGLTTEPLGCLLGEILSP